MKELCRVWLNGWLKLTVAVRKGKGDEGELFGEEFGLGRGCSCGWFTPGDEHVVILSTSAANKSGLKLGDTISIHTTLYSARWEIIGIAQDYNSPPGGLGVLLAPLQQVTAFEHLPPGFTQSVMVLSASRKQADIDALATRIADTLSKDGHR